MCADAYAISKPHTCVECQEKDEGGMEIIAVLASILVLTGIIVFWYMISVIGGVTEHRMSQRILQYVPTQTLKIVLIVWQIVTQASEL